MACIRRSSLYDMCIQLKRVARAPITRVNLNIAVDQVQEEHAGTAHAELCRGRQVRYVDAEYHHLGELLRLIAADTYAYGHDFCVAGGRIRTARK